MAVRSPKKVLALSLELEAPDAVISNEFADLSTGGTKGHRCGAGLPAGRRGGELACHKGSLPSSLQRGKEKIQGCSLGQA